MKVLYRWIGLLLLLVPMTGCDEGLDEAPEQQVFFEVNYSNGAWGNQYKGFLIDKKGQIRKYDDALLPAGGKSGGSLTAAELDAKLSTTVLAPETISAADLNAWVSKIGNISGSAYSKPMPGGYDAGIIRYYAYRYDPVKSRYLAVLLKQAGDEIINSEDQAALQIADWLSSVSGKIY